ncbi:type II toxin-antitoxin system VapC family toxin [Marinobacter lacisalsi]|uniref:Ribonuclease VapC n=1 Tax=Marinobacter lacisalsi TaxID=475979 RepID=A0ABV8QIR7_9GAMM
MTTFFDTNVLVYAAINQDSQKQATSERLIKGALRSNTLIISPLVLSEMVFVLSKLNVLGDYRDSVRFFSRFSSPGISRSDVEKATDLADELDAGKSINDLIHLVHAERCGCSAFVTFDKGFRRFADKVAISIEVLD